MKIMNFGKFLLIIFSLLILFSGKTAKAAGPCYCEKNDKSEANCRVPNSSGFCFGYPDSSTINCSMQYQTNIIPVQTAEQVCDSLVQNFNNSKKSGTPGTGSENAKDGQKVGKFLPACLFEKEIKGECRDVTIFLVLMFNIITYLFSIIGGVALLYFVYGGFIMILSQGNSEKVAQGKGVIVAAILGIIIAFSGYALVQFVGRVAGISNEFKLDSTQ